MGRPDDIDTELWQEALALLVAWQAKPGSRAMRDRVSAWCARSPAHRLAWDDAKRVWSLTGTATGAPARARPSGGSKRVNRRNVIAGVGVVAGSALLLKGPDLWLRWRADLHTDIGQIETRALADGSMLTLGPDSAVRFAISAIERRIDLLGGMAFFEVAKDERPFRVTADGFTATAHGTAFEVRADGDRLTVGVDSGTVSVAGGMKIGSVSVNANEWIAIDERQEALERGTQEAGQSAVWRKGLLIADEQPIRTVVAEIARWQSARVLIPQRDLADARVSGLFDLSDPQAALEIVVAPYGGQVRRVTPWLTILSTI